MNNLYRIKLVHFFKDVIQYSINHGKQYKEENEWHKRSGGREKKRNLNRGEESWQGSD